MATLVADTIKARASFPVAMAGDVQVSPTDTRSVEDAVAPATNTTFGTVKIGDGIKNDNGELSVDNYVTVSDVEPADKSMIWVDTKWTYSSSGEAIPVSHDDGNAMSIGTDDGLLVATAGRIANVLYLYDTPIRLMTHTHVYINYDSGSNDTGDGTAAKPFQTWDYANKFLPKDLGGNTLYVHIAGTAFVANKITLNFTCFQSGYFMLMPENVPTFYRMNVSNCRTFYIQQPCNFKYDTADGLEWQGALRVYDGSVVSLGANIAISTSTNLYRSGIYVDMGGLCIIQTECNLTTSNNTYALRTYCGTIFVRGKWMGTGNYAKAAAWNGEITYAANSSYSPCNGVTETFSGGQIRTTSNW